MRVTFKSDKKLKHQVTEELNADPSVTDDSITVEVKDGVAILRGTVPLFAEKKAAEKAAFRVRGIRAVADELAVNPKEPFERCDVEIASAVSSAIEFNHAIPSKIQISVDHGEVTLRGEVDWDFQRSAASHTIATILGVRAIKNEITLRPQPEIAAIKSKIMAAFERSAEDEGKHIAVGVERGSVTLSGQLRSYGAVEDAIFAAWAVPGVTQVKNNLRVTL